ncbi:MAG: hypothetical protein U0U70_08045 [Chitinophagaceae bacterium]
MQSYEFSISETQLATLLELYPNTGKNSHVGNIAVKVVELYFLDRYPGVIFNRGKSGADLEVNVNGKVDRYEIKGTIDNSISWSKLKVSSQDCYDCLMAGMTLIRVTSIGKTDMTLHFMKYGEDFTMEPEVRFAVKPIKKPRNDG